MGLHQHQPGNSKRVISTAPLRATASPSSPIASPDDTTTSPNRWRRQRRRRPPRPQRRRRRGPLRAHSAAASWPHLVRTAPACWVWRSCDGAQHLECANRENRPYRRLPVHACRRDTRTDASASPRPHPRRLVALAAPISQPSTAHHGGCRPRIHGRDDH